MGITRSPWSPSAAATNATTPPLQCFPLSPVTLSPSSAPPGLSKLLQGVICSLSLLLAPLRTQQVLILTPNSRILNLG